MGANFFRRDWLDLDFAWTNRMKPPPIPDSLHEAKVDLPKSAEPVGLGKRTLGVDAERGVVEADFDGPLPDDVIQDFEAV